MRPLALLLAITVNGFGQITIRYDARIILGGKVEEPRNSNPVALAEFLKTFNLPVVDGPEGAEIPISGTFSFKHPQKNLNVGTGVIPWHGWYELSGFDIKGVQLQPNPDEQRSMRIMTSLWPASGTFQRDTYWIELLDVIPAAPVEPAPPIVAAARSASSDRAAATQRLTLRLGVSLPAGTLATSDLPPDVSFLARADNRRVIPGMIYYAPTGESMGGQTVWLKQPCGDEDIQLTFSSDARNYHRYPATGEIIRTNICDKSDPRCTRKAVFDMMLSNAQFIAPTDDTSLVFDCKITFVRVPTPIDLPKRIDEPIRSVVDRNKYSVTNYTQPGHALHPGKVVRTVIEDEVSIYVETWGEGTGVPPECYVDPTGLFIPSVCAWLNVYVAPDVWREDVDAKLRNRFQEFLSVP